MNVNIFFNHLEGIILLFDIERSHGESFLKWMEFSFLSSITRSKQGNYFAGTKLSPFFSTRNAPPASYTLPSTQYASFLSCGQSNTQQARHPQHRQPKHAIALVVSPTYVAVPQIPPSLQLGGGPDLSMVFSFGAPDMLVVDDGTFKLLLKAEMKILWKQ